MAGGRAHHVGDEKHVKVVDDESLVALADGVQVQPPLDEAQRDEAVEGGSTTHRLKAPLSNSANATNFAKTSSIEVQGFQEFKNLACCGASKFEKGAYFL